MKNHIQLRVAISKFHDGQTVTPSVQAYKSGAWVKVTLSWYDATSGYSPETERDFRGPDQNQNAEKWLKSQGVHLDAQGIH